MTGRPLLLTIDVEGDKGPDWRTAAPLRFAGVAAGIGERLHPRCERLGVRPTYLLSPEVLTDQASVALLRSLPGCELGTHLHGEYVAPGVPTWDFASRRTDDMQRDYGSDRERDKLATLTELFVQQFGRAPRSFRAGRFGIGPHTGRHLRELGYLCDSSVTPFVRWTDRHGQPVPDFRHVGTSAWFVAPHGDLRQPGGSALLEVPVTIRSGPQGPRWFRPWYSSRAQLLQLIDEVAAEPDAPLCMMFHNVELLAGGSPYPQTDSDVARFLADLEAALLRAHERGFLPMTMAEAQRWAIGRRALAARPGPVPRTHSGSRRDRTTRLPAARVDDVVQRRQTQTWHAYAHRQRAERWDLTEPYSWLADRLPVDAAILDLGCGIGSNLVWLAEQGFSRLYGCDRDPTAIAAGRELGGEHQGLRLWVDDGLRPLAIPAIAFAAIAALNWTHLVPEFDLAAFLAAQVGRLQPGGYLVLDVVDTAFAQHPKHQWRTSDWDQPEAERRPSEYRWRHAREDVAAAAATAGMTIAAEFRREQTIPKAVYVLQRPSRPRLLFVVDEPGWAHDAKTEALRAQLGDEFDVERRYQQEVTAAEVAAADLVVVYYWLQLAGCGPLRAALAGQQQKLVLGVCSHAEIEGPRRDEALAQLRAVEAVFVHSELLRRQVAPLLRPEQRLFVLPNGVDTEAFAPLPARQRRPGPLRVGWAGSLGNFGRDLRGFDEIEATCAALPGVEFVPAIKERGQRAFGAMAGYYHGIDVYVCMSRCEGTPNPALEAAACGVPLVTTRVGNMPEFVGDGENGLFVRRGDGSLAAALARFRDDAMFRERCANGARRAALAWSWSVRARGFAAMFGELLGQDAGERIDLVVVQEADPEAAGALGGRLHRALPSHCAGELLLPDAGALHRQLASAKERALGKWLLIARPGATVADVQTALTQGRPSDGVPLGERGNLVLIASDRLQPFPLVGDDAWDLQWRSTPVSG
ncbi:MAG: glycosyltransferase [Planctomycetes bacterium]|nr:glycosyltransferase [Planctomycetota bacterium]